MLRRWFAKIGLALILLLPAPTGAQTQPAPTGAQTQPGPSETLRGFNGELLSVMQNAKALGAKGRYQKLEPVVQRTFDVPFMTRLSVGVLWGKLTVEQKQRAWKAFGRYIAATYANRFDGYSGEQFKVIGEQKIKHGVLGPNPAGQIGRRDDRDQLCAARQ